MMGEVGTGDTVSRYSPFTAIPESTVVLYHRCLAHINSLSTTPDEFLAIRRQGQKQNKTNFKKKTENMSSGIFR